MAERRKVRGVGHKTRRKPTKNIEYVYDTPPCLMGGCRAVETKLFDVSGGEWYCVRHSKKMIHRCPDWQDVA